MEYVVFRGFIQGRHENLVEFPFHRSKTRARRRCRDVTPAEEPSPNKAEAVLPSKGQISRKVL